MAEQRPQSSDRERGPKVRFEALILPGPKLKRTNFLEEIQRLDIDRIQDPKGQIRALVTADDCVRLLDRGFEVRLYYAHPVRRIDRALIETDEAVRRAVEDRLRGVPRATGSGGSAGHGGR